MEYMKGNERLLMQECAGCNITAVRDALGSITGTANIVDEDRTSLLHIVQY